MPVNVSVIVKEGNVSKALRAFERKLRKEKLWEYDPEKRPYSGGKKARKRRKKTP